MDSKGADAGLLQSRYRLTKQRAAILHALEDGEHLSAETILDRVRTEMPGVSLGTIYRTLDILRQIGLVQMFSFNGSAARYEASLDKHHHLICQSCGDIRNVAVPDVQGVALAVAAQQRFDDVDVALVVTGRCETCSTHAAKNGTVEE